MNPLPSPTRNPSSKLLDFRYLYIMKTIVHINQHNIRSNATKGTDVPVITVKTYKDNTYAKEVIIYGQDGLECARVIYSPDKPLSCGARVWIETTCKVSAIQEK